MFAAFENDDFVLFLRGNTRDNIARTQRGFQFFIGKQVEFLLHLTLDILGATGTQDINQTRFVDISMDDFGTQFYCREQCSQLTGSMGKFMLLFDNKFT